MDKYVGNLPALSQKCYKSPYYVRQLSASAEKLGIRVCRWRLAWNRQSKKVHQKGPKSEKKSYDLGGDWTQVGYNSWGLREVHKSPQLFICGFDRNVAQLFSDPSLHQCLHHPIKSEQKHALICYNNTRVARWRAFNFAKVPCWYVLCMPRYDELKVVF